MAATVPVMLKTSLAASQESLVGKTQTGKSLLAPTLPVILQQKYSTSQGSTLGRTTMHTDESRTVEEVINRSEATVPSNIYKAKSTF